MKITIRELAEVVSDVIAEAKKKAKKPDEEKQNGFKYSPQNDFSAPLGKDNLYKKQGAANFGPYTNSSGETINDVNKGFSSFFEKLKKWNFCFTISPKIEIQISLDFKVRPLAQNKGKKLLGVILEDFKIIDLKSFEMSGQHKILQTFIGKIYILPTLENGLSIEIISILEKVLNCSLERCEPDWSIQIEFDKSRTIKEKIQDFKKSECEIQQKIQSHQGELAHLNEYKKLLWATGHPLEDIIHSCFNNDLNLQISRPQKGEDDGIFEFESIIYLVEIKSGENKPARFDELSKLIARMNKLKETHSKKNVKGLFIMNHYANFSLNERKEPFSNQIKEHSKIENITLLTSPDLYNIMMELLHGKITREDAIKKMLN